MRTVGLGASGNNVFNEERLLERIADLEKENAELKKKVDTAKKKSKIVDEKKRDAELGQDTDLEISKG